MPPRVLVLVPTYNERENLPVLVRGILELPGFRVMVIDDQSPDGTGAVADSLASAHPDRVTVLHRTGPRGLGRSYVDALTLAVGMDDDFVCQMDADLSHDPKYLPDLVALAQRGHDLVIGSRYLQGVSVVNWPLHRLVLSAFANRYIRAVTGLSPRDCTSGFRCWRRDFLRHLPLDRIASDGYAFLVEMLFEANRRGCRLGEVPIIFIERRVGQSKLDTGVLVESVFTPWRIRLRALGQRRPPLVVPDASRAENVRHS
ncbi:MAG: polyprenol monophosphomannose synthase [Vicinamibacterales bacterium]